MMTPILTMRVSTPTAPSTPDMFVVLLIALVVLVVSLLLGLGIIRGLRGRASRIANAAVAVTAAVVMAAVAVFVSTSAGSTGAVAQAGGGHSAPAEAEAAASTSTSTEASNASDSEEDRASLPEGFVYLRDVAPDIEVELRYATTNNFTGQIVDGYESTDAAVLRTEAAEALAEVQHHMAVRGYGLRVYDAFRPTRAVSFFMDWATTADVSTKAEYYPDFEKPRLFELGYIAEKSGHSLGGTVDLTLVDLLTGEPLDMGGPFDFFGDRSHYETSGLTSQQLENRALLHDAMQSQGFAQYPLEWWHYSYPLEGDPQAMDFVVR